jgi:Fe-S-cluster containining protein
VKFEKVKGVVFSLDLNKPDASVPCGACQLCCKNTPVMLTERDDVKSYDHVYAPDGKTPFLRMKENGDCVYLAAAGCSIHSRAPYACRIFDCRAMFKSMTRDERRDMIRRRAADAQILRRGRELLEQ